MYSSRQCPTEVKQENNVCSCCLSRDRILKPLGLYTNIFLKLMNDKISILDNMQPHNIHVCWECISMLRNVIQFQTRVENAHEIMLLSEIRNTKLEMYSTLSSLTTKVLNNEDVNCFVTHQDHEEVADIYDCKVEYEDAMDDAGYDDGADAREELDEQKFKVEFEKEECNSKLLNIVGDAVVDLKISDVLIERIKEDEDNEVMDQHKCDKVIGEDNPRKYVHNKKYKVLKLLENDGEEYKFTKTISVDHEEIRRIREECGIDPNYVKAAYKCETCVVPFKDHLALKLHFAQCHFKSAKALVCDICQQHFLRKQSLISHVKQHFYQYQCSVCGHVFYKPVHVYNHVRVNHSQILQCLSCDTQYCNRREFFAHYRRMHQRFVCDYCGKRVTEKHTIRNHILKHHTPVVCRVCRKQFKHYRYLKEHERTFHTVLPSELAYCVECNLMFNNEDLYKRHLRNSVRHKPKLVKKSFPCPECDKVYARRCTMNYHVNYVHKRQSRFSCDQCEKSFLNGFRLRQHKASAHYKTPLPKSKICTICSRGFTTNRILENHVRTHTGERPFTCQFCPAAFAQKIAMNVHINNIHFKEKKL